MTIITNGRNVYRVHYIRRYMPEWPDRPAERDCLKVQADTSAQATDIAIRQMQTYHAQDARYSYQVMRALTELDAI